MKRMLLIVDAQYDFINGSLPVAGAAEAMDALAKYIGDLEKGYYDQIVMTADFHPWEHCSFGEWPVHCVAHTKGAAIWQAVAEASFAHCSGALVLTKGTCKDTEEYSIMKNRTSRERLMPILDGMDEVDCCGIAGDICLLNSVKDLIEWGYRKKIHVLEEFSPSLDGGKALKEFLKEI